MSFWHDLTVTVKDYSGINLARDYFASRNQKNAVFIWIPKAAGTSVHIAINARKFISTHKIRFQFSGRGIATFGHMNYAELVKQGYVSEKFDASAFKFAITRNPYDRAVSLFTYLKARKKIDSELSFLSLLRMLADEGCPPIGLYNAKRLSQCNPQVRWLEGIDIDFIGRLENIHTDINHIANKLDIVNVAILHKNASSRRTTASYYCNECFDIVEHIYREDFRDLNYPKREKPDIL